MRFDFARERSIELHAPIREGLFALCGIAGLRIVAQVIALTHEGIDSAHGVALAAI
jgi:hypothetical protein